MGMVYENRVTAGEILADKINPLLEDETELVIVALPRGGVEVAAVMADMLGASLRLLSVKKIPYPSNPEFAIGAMAPDGLFMVDEEFAGQLPEKYIDTQRDIIASEIERRQAIYGHCVNPEDVAGKIVILVDDGAATGYTALAAGRYLAKLKPLKLIVALPVMPQDVRRQLVSIADEVIGFVPEVYDGAVGNYYGSFEQLSDGQVLELMKGRK